MRSSKKVACLSALAFVLACSGKSSDDAASFFVNETAPADTTGAKSSINLTLTNPSSLGLTADGTLAIGNDIVLNYAKFNIAKIKIKANKELSEDEEKLEGIEKEEEEKAVGELESETDDTEESVSLKGRSNKERKDVRTGKIKEKKNELKRKEEDSLRKEVAQDRATKFSGPFIYDAVTGKLEGISEAPAAELLDGSYRRVEFQLKRNFDASESEALLGNVFAIKGTVLKAGAAVPFEIEWHSSLNFRMTSDSSILIKANEENDILVDFNIAKWFDGIDLTAANVDSDGTIYINKHSNKVILKQIKRNIKLSSGFGKDSDDDKKLSSEERVGEGEETGDADVE